MEKVLISINKIFKIMLLSFILFVRLGWRGSIFLVYIYIFLPNILRLVKYYIKFYRYLVIIYDTLFVSLKLKILDKNKNSITSNNCTKSFVEIEDFGIDIKAVKKIKKLHKTKKEVLIAEIDQDGYFLSYFGKIKDSPIISDENFIKRKRYKLQIVSLNGVLGVKKYYKNDKKTFISEITILYKLIKAGCNVPLILDIDCKRLTFTHTYILGDVIRDTLVQKGALIRDRDIEKKEEYYFLNLKDKWLKRIEEAKKYLQEVIDKNFIQSLFKEFQKIHALGIRVFDVKYGNIIIEKQTQKPYLIDFNSSQDFSKINKVSKRVVCDFDIELFNLHFNTDYYTYRELKKRIKQKDIPFIKEWYSPVYFGYGLIIGKLWDLEHGDGRWHFILKKNLPSLTDKRILDLGANTGFNSMQMLRNGASEAIGIELNKKFIEQGNFLKLVFEWADNKSYNFKYINSNMNDIPKMNLGNFDIVIALCSIYYLDDDQITSLINYISKITDLFILQCNTKRGIGRKDPKTYEKASVEYTVSKLKSNGFPFIRIISPRFYNRPLIIASKE